MEQIGVAYVLWLNGTKPDYLVVALHNHDRDSHIVDLHNNNDFLIVDLHNQDKDCRIIAVHNNDSLCMCMFTFVALF